MKSGQAIEVSDLRKQVILDNNQPLEILKELSLSAHYGEFISIIGASGSGKTTLLKCISSLNPPSGGQIKIDGLNPYQLNDSKLAAFRRNKIGFIFQSYNLIPALPVIENIALPLRLDHKKVDEKEISKILQQMNFNADIHAFVGSLSGGEQQKVAIARVLMANSDIIFADEPTGALDSLSRQIVFDLLRNLADAGKCVVMVTHDIEMAAQTDKAMIIKDGKLLKTISAPSSDKLYQALNGGQ